jgi:branched-chain amino acid transport system substrate-binding protein
MGKMQICMFPVVAAYQDYINLVNLRGGVEGYRIKGDEIDIEFKVPPAVEAYERQKAEGAVSITQGALVRTHGNDGLHGTF